MKLPAGIAVFAVLLGAWGLWPGDPVAAMALTDHCLATTTDLGDDAWLDPARDLARIRPWQAGFGRARRCLSGIGEARRVRFHDPNGAPISTAPCS